MHHRWGQGREAGEISLWHTLHTMCIPHGELVHGTLVQCVEKHMVWLLQVQGGLELCTTEKVPGLAESCDTRMSVPCN